MRFSEFKKHIKSPWWRMDQGMLLVDLKSLTTFTWEQNIKLVQDQRSFYDNIEGFWHVYPIATDRVRVYIVCPYCGDIHIHGAGGGNYEGHRVEHCKDPRIKGIVNGYCIERENQERKTL